MSNLVWDSYKLESSVQKFADCIYNYREKVDELITVETTIDTHLKELDICIYVDTKFSDVLYEIQKSIDYLNLKYFSNPPQWVSKLDAIYIVWFNLLFLLPFFVTLRFLLISHASSKFPSSTAFKNSFSVNVSD